MATIKVRPAEGVRVVQPGPGGMPIPPDGIEVPDTAFYRRLILTGDLIDESPEAAGAEEQPGTAAEPVATAEPAADPKPDTGRRRAQAEQE